MIDRLSQMQNFAAVSRTCQSLMERFIADRAPQPLDIEGVEDRFVTVASDGAEKDPAYQHYLELCREEVERACLANRDWRCMLLSASFRLPSGGYVVRVFVPTAIDLAAQVERFKREIRDADLDGRIADFRPYSIIATPQIRG